MKFQMKFQGVSKEMIYAVFMTAKGAPGGPGRVPSPESPCDWLTPDEQQTWISLHLVLATLPGALGDQLRRDADLGFLDYYVLAVLSEQPEQTMRMSDLALLAGSELSRLSHVAKRLEARCFLRREPDPSDGRFTNAILTEAGRAMVLRSAPGHVDEVRRLVFDVLDPAEQHALRAALTKIASGLIGNGTLDKILPGPIA